MAATYQYPSSVNKHHLGPCSPAPTSLSPRDESPALGAGRMAPEGPAPEGDKKDHTTGPPALQDEGSCQQYERPVNEGMPRDLPPGQGRRGSKVLLTPLPAHSSSSMVVSLDRPHPQPYPPRVDYPAMSSIRGGGGGGGGDSGDLPGPNPSGALVKYEPGGGGGVDLSHNRRWVLFQGTDGGDQPLLQQFLTPEQQAMMTGYQTSPNNQLVPVCRDLQPCAGTCGTSSRDPPPTRQTRSRSNSSGTNASRGERTGLCSEHASLSPDCCEPKPIPSRRRQGKARMNKELEELVALGEVLQAQSDKGDLIVRRPLDSGGARWLPLSSRMVQMQVRMELKLTAYHPKLLREYMVHEDTVGDPARRRAPVILVELTDGYLEEAVANFFKLYEDFHQHKVPDYERPSLLIFVDLTSKSTPVADQLALVEKIERHFKQLEHSPNPAYREAVSRILLNDPHAQIEGLSLASSNDLLLSTIRKSTVCGLNFLRYLSGQDQMLNLYRLKVVDNKVSGQDDSLRDDTALPPPETTGEEPSAMEDSGLRKLPGSLSGVL